MDIKKVTALRQDTPGCNTFNHLNNAGSSLMPQPVIDAILGHIDLEAHMGGYEAHAFTEAAVAATYEEAARFLGCSARNVALVSNATDAFARALSSVPFERGDVILTSEDDYISNQLMYLSLQKRMGIQLQRVPCSASGGIDIDLAGKAIREQRPRLVAITHVPTNSGLVQDVQSVGQICEEEDVLYLVDVCQSVGQLQVDVGKIKCDFLSATMRKFLRGPRGAGFLYVSDKVLDAGLEPLFLDMQGAEWLEKDGYSPMQDAHRFEDWEFAYALVHGTREAFKYANEVGMDQIEPRVTHLSQRLRSKLQQVDRVEVLDRGTKQCAIVTCKLPLEDYQEMKDYLKGLKINAGVSLWHFATIDFQRKGVSWALRLAPHYFNTTEEIDEVVEAIEGFPF